MADILQPYSVDEFNKIPDLHKAHTDFVAKDGKKFVCEVFRPLVEKYKLQGEFGIGILHRHSTLIESEKLVEVNNVSIPWNHEGSDDSHPAGRILPMSWLLNDGKVMPYEFFFLPHHEENHVALNEKKSIDLTIEKFRNFLDEFAKAAKCSGLDRVVALRLFPYPGYRGGMEFTVDRINIVLKPGQVSHPSSYTFGLALFHPLHYVN
jgi:hypothetical protein